MIVDSVVATVVFFFVFHSAAGCCAVVDVSIGGTMDDKNKHELEAQVFEVLKNAKPGKSEERKPGFLTAYQVLNRLPDQLRDALVQEYGKPGRGSTSHFTAASRGRKGSRGSDECREGRNDS
jgi:hypothetical protein